MVAHFQNNILKGGRNQELKNRETLLHVSLPSQVVCSIFKKAYGV